MKMEIEIVSELAAWYEDNQRKLPWREDTEPYHVWLSEIMLQQTRVEAVKGYYRRFLEELPTIADLANASDEKLMKLWEGLGYYSRVRNLKKAAITVMEDYGGKFPGEYKNILNLSGIGDYTASAIGSICYNLPTPAVDGNVLRVYSRVMEDASNIDNQSTKRAVREALMDAYAQLEPLGKCGQATQSLMELGACVCVPNGAPKCEICPISHMCQAYKHGTQSDYPVRNKKKERKIQEKTVFICKCEDRYAIRKRGEKGLLKGMWEFPNVDGLLEAGTAAKELEKLGAIPAEITMDKKYTHIFTHVEWRMVAYYFECQKMNDDFRWVSLSEMEQEVAIPSAFAPFVREAFENEDTKNHNV